MTEDMDEVRKVGVGMSDRRYTPIMNQLKALQTRILKMENPEKCWPHHCMYMGEEKIMVLLKNPTASRKPEAEVIQKRGVSVQRTQADTLEERV